MNNRRAVRRLSKVLRHVASQKNQSNVAQTTAYSEHLLEYTKNVWWGPSRKLYEDTSVRTFEINVHQSVLDDLKRRLDNTRYPPNLPTNRNKWDYGMEQKYLRELVDYWKTDYDWRKHERDLNALPHFRTTIDGIDLHFIHVKSSSANAVPLLITHGWPGSVWEFQHIIPLLTSQHSGISFDIVAPSIPGYAWSSKPSKVGYNTVQTAVTFSKLMERLGYDSYIAQGGDWGAAVTTNIALVDPEHCKGIHLNMINARPPKENPMEGLSKTEIERLAPARNFGYEMTGYLHEQATKPHTLGFPLTDSPAGLAAWIVEKFHGWSDCHGDIETRFNKDELLTNVMIYWVTNSATSSVQYYKESIRSPETNEANKRAIHVPAGLVDFPKELLHVPRKWAEQRFSNIVTFTHMDRGGHFAAREEPRLLADDIRNFCIKLHLQSVPTNSKSSTPNASISTPPRPTDSIPIPEKTKAAFPGGTDEAGTATEVTGPLKIHSRYKYSPIRGRPKYSWPNNKKLAVYIGLNLEHFDYGNGLGAKLGMAPSHPDEPDVLNYAWRDYGNRVGVWRLLSLFDELNLPVSLLINTSLYDYCPSVIEAFRKRGDEVLAHGHTNSVRQGEMKEDVERKLIKNVTNLIKENEGKHPSGWLGPWISQSATTIDLLKGEGYKFVLDWCHDDQPTYFACRDGSKLLSVPYQQEINDIPAVVGRKSGAKEFADDLCAAFDEYLKTVSETDEPLVYGIALHPYIVGQPHRLNYLRDALRYVLRKSEESGLVWITKAGDIAKFVETLPTDTIP